MAFVLESLTTENTEGTERDFGGGLGFRLRALRLRRDMLESLTADGRPFGKLRSGRFTRMLLGGGIFDCWMLKKQERKVCYE